MSFACGAPRLLSGLCGFLERRVWSRRQRGIFSTAAILLAAISGLDVVEQVELVYR